jgi:hypothetical protein
MKAASAAGSAGTRRPGEGPPLSGRMRAMLGHQGDGVAVGLGDHPLDLLVDHAVRALRKPDRTAAQTADELAGTR